jgi:hypothetical protein
MAWPLPQSSYGLAEEKDQEDKVARQDSAVSHCPSHIPHTCVIDSFTGIQGARECLLYLGTVDASASHTLFQLPLICLVNRPFVGCGGAGFQSMALGHKGSGICSQGAPRSTCRAARNGLPTLRLLNDIRQELDLCAA